MFTFQDGLPNHSQEAPKFKVKVSLALNSAEAVVTAALSGAICIPGHGETVSV